MSVSGYKLFSFFCFKSSDYTEIEPSVVEKRNRGYRRCGWLTSFPIWINILVVIAAAESSGQNFMQYNFFDSTVAAATTTPKLLERNQNSKLMKSSQGIHSLLTFQKEKFNLDKFKRICDGLTKCKKMEGFENLERNKTGYFLKIVVLYFYSFYKKMLSEIFKLICNQKQNAKIRRCRIVFQIQQGNADVLCTVSSSRS